MNQQATIQSLKKPSTSLTSDNILQRKCACGNHTVAGGECAECRKKKLQRKATNQRELQVVPGTVHEALRFPGQPLDPTTRTVMEQRFGHNFSQVRVHSGSLAEQSARDVKAHAYTVGQDIVFGARQFAPGQRSAISLLAHELTHTIQQRGTNFSLAKHSVKVAANNSPLEREADAAADSVAKGGLAHIQAGTASAPKLQRKPTDASIHPSTSGENKAIGDGVPYEKWSPQVEALYRKVGDPRADAVARCRKEGKVSCALLLTLNEVDALYDLASKAKGDKAKIRAELPKIIPTLALLGPLPAASTITEGAVAGGAATGAVATAAAAASAIAIVAVVALAGYELWILGKFQEALRVKGFTILEDPLRQAICHSCHTAPTPKKFDFPKTKPGFPDFPDIDPEMLKRFAEPVPLSPTPLPTKEKKPSPDEKPKPTIDVMPDPKTDEEERKRRPKDACQIMMGLQPGINARWHRQRPAIAGHTTVHAAAFRLDRGIPAPVGQDTTPDSRSWVRAIGLPKDDAGHVIANRFGGRADFNALNGNIFPQDLSFNRGTMRSYDGVVAKLHQSGCDVCVNIGLMYASPTDLRPSSAMYTYLYRSVGATGFNPPISALVPNP